jgi:hypothetical protein
MEVFVKKLAVLAICGCVSLCSGMDVPKFGSGVKNPELRELIQTWETVKSSGRFDREGNAGVLNVALGFIVQFCFELKGLRASKECTDSVMNGLCFIYKALETAETAKEADRVLVGSLEPKYDSYGLLDGSGYDFSDL